MTGPHADGGVEGKFFDARQRATIEAAMARIIPTDDQPGGDIVKCCVSEGGRILFEMID